MTRPSPKGRTSSNNATLGIKPHNTLALREKLIQPQGFVEACLRGLHCMHRQRHTVGSPLLGVCWVKEPQAEAQLLTLPLSAGRPWKISRQLEAAHMCSNWRWWWWNVQGKFRCQMPLLEVHWTCCWLSNPIAGVSGEFPSKGLISSRPTREAESSHSDIPGFASTPFQLQTPKQCVSLGHWFLIQNCKFDLTWRDTAHFKSSCFFFLSFS